MKIRMGILVASLAAGIVVSASADNLTAEQWGEDLNYWEHTLRDTHPAPFHSVSEESFYQAVSDIRSHVDAWPDYGVALEMIRLAALVADGHTYLYDRGEGGILRSLPIEVYPFSDGMFVRYAMDGYSELVGAQVLTIGGVPIEEVMEAASAYIGGDNEWTVLARTPWLAICPEFLEWKGFIGDRSRVTLGIRDAQGQDRDVTLEPVDGADYYAWRNSPKPVDGAPMYRQRADVAYWKTFLEPANAVYMQFNAVRNLEGGPHLARFSQELVDFIDEKKADYLIIDARHNGGGNGDLLKPLIRRIANHSRINRPGHLYVLSSRVTFSAALMFLGRMERQTHVIFAGEPSGGKPNSYGEFNAVTLPNSGLRGSISSLWHEEGEPDDTREFIDVHMPVALSSSDWFGSRDPVLDAVLTRIREGT